LDGKLSATLLKKEVIHEVDEDFKGNSDFPVSG